MPNTPLAEIKEFLNQQKLEKFTKVGMFFDQPSHLGTIVNNDDSSMGIDFKMSTDYNGNTIQLCVFRRDSELTKDGYKELANKYFRLSRPNYKKVKQIIIDKYAPDHHPEKNI